MSSPLLNLRERSRQFSTTQREVAAQILQNPRMVAEMSIHALAKHTFSSPSTIVRLCNELGYSGYRAFRKAVVEELARREQALRPDQTEIERSDSLTEIIDKITGKNIISLEETRDLMDVEVMRTCMELVKKARVVYLFGMGASLCAAKDAYLKFLRLNKVCVVNEDWHSQLLQARNAGKADLGILITYSGATLEIIECAKALKENGTPTIAITRCVNSPITELADHKLYTAASESLFRSGAMSSRISQLSIIDILYTALANDQYDQTLRQLSKTHIQKPGVPVGRSKP